MTRADRFWSKVDRTAGPDACWPWTGGIRESGYGRYGARPAVQAHRLAWQLTNGPIPDGIMVCHSCDADYPAGDRTYRRCCNPRHLFLGDHAANMADMAAKRRAATGERSGRHTKPERTARGDRNGSRLHPERRPRGVDHFTYRHPERRPKGERNPKARLTAEIVRALRRDYAERPSNWPGHGVVATRLGVDRRTVSKIVRGQLWRHLIDAEAGRR